MPDRRGRQIALLQSVENSAAQWGDRGLRLTA